MKWQQFSGSFTPRCGSQWNRRVPSTPTGQIVSPDGELNFLSFATLLDPEQRFVAEKYSINYVTSGRDLLRVPQPALSKQVIVMADPKFNRQIPLANHDLPSEDSGMLRGTEKRDIEDLVFEELGGNPKGKG
jgi:hypothetical protein